METLVPSALAASAPERARAVQALLDAHGAEMDRRRELTPEVVDSLAGQDLLRMLLPKSQPVQRIGRHVRRLHAVRSSRRHVRRSPRRPCLGRPA